jgi:hypothetical protein
VHGGTPDRIEWDELEHVEGVVPIDKNDAGLSRRFFMESFSGDHWVDSLIRSLTASIGGDDAEVAVRTIAIYIKSCRYAEVVGNE